jgi:hypothetical protein
MTQQLALCDLGDALERAARLDLRTRRRRSIRIVAVLAVAVALGTGAAVAGGLLSADRVAAGMPAGSALFGGTHPTCTLLADGVTYDCALASRPTEETSEDWTGAKELLTIDRRIAGGCIGQDAAGLRWKCYLGDEAVARSILSGDLLGQYAPVPSRG